MRPSDYLLNPEKLDIFVGYIIALLLSASTLLAWGLRQSKKKTLVALRIK